MLGLPENNTAMDRARAMGFDTPAYHGTNADVGAFDLSRTGSASGAEQYGTGVYTATNPSIASGYALPNKDGANVMPLMVAMRNPITPETANNLTRQQIKSLLQKSPELDDALWNFGDVGYEGKSKVLNGAVNQLDEFRQEKLLDSLHPIANDFYPNSPVEFNDALAKVTKRDGVTVNFDSGDKFHIPWNANQVRSRFAAFDPARRHEADLLGYADPSLLGAISAGGLLGLGGYSLMGDK
jgi:hypothetical protein